MRVISAAFERIAAALSGDGRGAEPGGSLRSPAHPLAGLRLEFIGEETSVTNCRVVSACSVSVQRKSRTIGNLLITVAENDLT